MIGGSVTFPNGPYGQEFPGQSGYPQQGFPQQPLFPQQPAFPQQPGYPPPGYPQQGFPQQPGYPGSYQPTPPGEPSGVTGVIAAVLAGLGALANLGGGILGLFGLAMVGSDTGTSGLSGGVYAMLIFGLLLGILCGLLLLAGTVTLLQRKMIGRWLVIGGCILAIVGGLVSLGLSAAVANNYAGYGGTLSGTGPTIVGLIFPIATIVLAMLGSTTAWIQAKQNPPAAPYYPPYQG